MAEIVQEIFTDQIDDPRRAMRSELDRDALFELADNIKQNGLINPITVRPVGTRFEVVAGHRRLSACKIAGVLKIKCVVRPLSDEQAFGIMAAENLERADVDPVDEARFLSEFMERTKKTTQEVAKMLRRSVHYVETRLAIGAMPDYMQQFLKTGELKLGAALYLVQITDERIRRMWVEMAARDGVSVVQAQYWLQGWKLNQLPGAVATDTPPADFQGAASQPVMLECSIDGKKHDARLCHTLIVAEENMPLFAEFVRLLRTPPASADIAPAAPSDTAASET